MFNRPSTEGNSRSGDFMPFHVFARKTPLGVGIGCRHEIIFSDIETMAWARENGYALQIQLHVFRVRFG